MRDLRSKYDDLLEVMRLGFKDDEGKVLTFYSEDFYGRIQGLMCLFNQFGTQGKDDFDRVLPDWTWNHYIKVLEELQALGVLDNKWQVIPEACEEVSEELQKIAEDNFYV